MLREEARKMADEAKSKGMWLFDPQYKRWYSPEDFKHTFNYASCSDELLNRLQIKHPSEGIQAGFKRLAEVQGKLQGLIKTVMEYYKL